MNKKILGIRVGTILTAFVCLAVAFLLWLLIKYSGESAEEISAAFTRQRLI